MRDSEGVKLSHANHREPRTHIVLEHRSVTEQTIGLAIEVHRHIGSGPLESAYAECQRVELERADVAFEQRIMVPHYL
jgi:hypothetical protein